MRTNNQRSLRDQRGRFNQGNPGKPKGARNKIAGELKDILSEVIRGEYTAEKIQSYLQALDDADKLRFFVQLLPYLAPKAPAEPPAEEPEDMEGFDLSKLTDEELRIIARLQEKATTPPIRWGPEENPIKEIRRVVIYPDGKEEEIN